MGDFMHGNPAGSSFGARFGDDANPWAAADALRADISARAAAMSKGAGTPGAPTLPATPHKKGFFARLFEKIGSAFHGEEDSVHGGFAASQWLDTGSDFPYAPLIGSEFGASRNSKRGNIGA